MNFGPEARQVTKADGIATTIPVNAAEQVYCKSMVTTYGETFGLSLKASGTTPDVRVRIQQSHVLPTTEGASDVKYTVPTGVTNPYVSLTTTAWIHMSLSIIALKFLRIHLDGNAGNGADVTVEAYVSVQEKFGVS